MTLLKQLPNLYAALRSEGLEVTVREEIVVRDLLLALAAERELPASANDLRELVRPILCRTNDDQSAFQLAFSSVFPESGAKVTPISPKERRARSKRRRESNAAPRKAHAFLYVGIAIALIAAGSFFAHRHFTKPDQPIATADPAPDVTPPQPAGPVVDIGPAGPKADGPVTLVPIPEWAPMWTKPAWDLIPKTWWPHVPLALWILAGAIALAAFIAFLRRFRHRYLNRRLINAAEDAPDDVIFQVPIRSPFPEADLRQSSLELRRHLEIDALGRLDVLATLHASLRKAGWFTPVGKRLKRTPEYLALIQEESRADHRAQMARFLAGQLQTDGVPVVVWTFRGEPDLLYPDADEGGVAEPLTLDQLHARTPDCRLLVFYEPDSATATFSRPTNAGEGGPRRLTVTAASDLALWENGGAWFADFHPEDVPSHLIAAPGGFEGLSAYTSLLRGETLPKIIPQARHDVPSILTRDRETWTDPHPPEPAVLQAGLGALEAYLGEPGFKWLCACAAYPELDWNLTMALGFGERLAVNGKRSQATRGVSAHRSPLTVNRLLTLPWFEEGAMPQWLRRALLHRLGRTERRQVDRALNRILVEGAAEASGDEAARNHVHQLIAKNPGLIQRLGRKMRRSGTGGGWKESTVMDFFGGGSGFRIPRLKREPRPAIQPDAKRARGAIWTLIWGFLGFFTAGITGLLALWAGRRTKQRIRKAGGRLKGWTQATVGQTMGLLSIVTTVITIGTLALAFPVFNAVMDKGRMEKSLAQIDQLIKANKIYALDYDGDYASDFKTLHDDLDLGLTEIFRSPGNPNPHAPVDLGDPSTIDYEYVHLSAKDTMPSSTPLIRDKFAIGGKVAVGPTLAVKSAPFPKQKRGPCPWWGRPPNALWPGHPRILARPRHSRSPPPKPLPTSTPWACASSPSPARIRPSS